jgi:hypothetical protein
LKFRAVFTPNEVVNLGGGAAGLGPQKAEKTLGMDGILVVGSPVVGLKAAAVANEDWPN